MVLCVVSMPGGTQHAGGQEGERSVTKSPHFLKKMLAMAAGRGGDENSIRVGVLWLCVCMCLCVGGALSCQFKLPP